MKLKCLVSLCFLSGLLAAQPSGDYLNFGLGYAFQTVKDNAMSPVSYSGHFGRLNIGHYYQNENWLSQFDLSAMGGIQLPDVGNEAESRRTVSGLARAHYSLSYKVYENNNWHFFAGILSHNLGDYRNHNRYTNSQSNYTGLCSFGPVFSVQKPFELFSQLWGVQYMLGLPFGTYYLRPGYIKPFFNGKISEKGWAWWGDFFLMDSRTDLIYFLDNGNQLRLSYHWEYAQLDKLNKVQLGAHHLSISSIFRF